jgi:23S rRNA pseudouridine955/2504/2580 synthase
MGLKRMFLHAWKLQLRHPVSGENLNLVSALPPELQQFIHTLQPPSGDPVAPL